MRIFMTILFLMNLIAPAGAVIDPEPDQIGLYFDTGANETCTEVPLNVLVPLYVIITNPTRPVAGIEFGICTEFVEGDGAFLLESRDFPFDCLAPVDTEYRDLCTDGLELICGEPDPVPGSVVVVMEVQYILLQPAQILFYLGQDRDPLIDDGLPAYWSAEGDIVPLGISSSSPNLPVAQVNGDCVVVAAESSTFGRVKAAYR